jgi:hypothetical protein
VTSKVKITKQIHPCQSLTGYDSRYIITN